MAANISQKVYKEIAEMFVDAKTLIDDHYVISAEGMRQFIVGYLTNILETNDAVFDKEKFLAASKTNLGRGTYEIQV